MRLNRTAFLLLTALTAGCGEDEGVTGVFAPGASGRIVLTHVQAAGGHLYHETITVDSATARFEV